MATSEFPIVVLYCLLSCMIIFLSYFVQTYHVTSAFFCSLQPPVFYPFGGTSVLELHPEIVRWDEESGIAISADLA